MTKKKRETIRRRIKHKPSPCTPCRASVLCSYSFGSYLRPYHKTLAWLMIKRLRGGGAGSQPKQNGLALALFCPRTRTFTEPPTTPHQKKNHQHLSTNLSVTQSVSSLIIIFINKEHPCIHK